MVRYLSQNHTLKLFGKFEPISTCEDSKDMYCKWKVEHPYARAKKKDTKCPDILFLINLSQLE